MHTPASKLALGSVQWGLAYGIANKSGQPPRTTVASILAAASAAGIDLIDTAHAYGEAEATIGALAESNAFRIITKTALGDTQSPTARTTLASSLTRLARKTVYGVLVHNAASLLSPEGPAIWRELEKARVDGQVERIGLSVYTPAELLAVLESYPIEIVQLPFSIYDQRFAASGLFDTLAARGVEIHSRSAFLQGILLMHPNELPRQLARLGPHQARLHNALSQQGLTPLQGALLFCLSETRIARVVVGAETEQQLSEILSAARHDPSLPLPEVTDYGIDDDEILLPFKWRQT